MNTFLQYKSNSLYLLIWHSIQNGELNKLWCKMSKEMSEEKYFQYVKTKQRIHMRLI